MAGAHEMACAWSPGGQPRPHSSEDDDRHGKRPVLARVKDMVRRWRRSFGRKKHARSGAWTSPAGGIRLTEKEDVEVPEFRGDPVYENARASVSVAAPESFTGTPTAKAPSMESSPRIKEPAEVEQSGNESPDSTNGEQEEFPGVPPAAEPAAPPEAVLSDGASLAQNVSELVLPAYNMVAGMTQAIASKIHGQPETNTPAGEEGSVKDYLMEKLQPGEDEEALSQVITEAISHRNGADGEGSEAGQGVAGTVEKLKGAVSSLLVLEGTSQSSPAGEVVSDTATVSPATEKVVAGDSEEGIPVSTHPSQGFLGLME